MTDNAQLGNASNYYLIIENVTFGYALARTSSGRPASKSLSNPFTAPNELWTLESSGTGYKFKNIIDNTYFTSAAGDWNTSMSNTPNAAIIATLNDGIYTLSAGGTSSIGHWRDDTCFPYENENVAANKSNANRNTYKIFTISQTDYATQRASYIASIAATGTKDNPADLTNFIVNNSDFAVMAKLGWTTNGSAGNQQTGNGAFETWNSNNVSITQDLANMPRGLYKLTVQMVSGDAGRVPALYAKGDEEYTANVSQQASDASYDAMKNAITADASYGMIAVNPHLTADGTLTVGMKATSGWAVFDNFKLYYLGKTIKSEAIALPNGGAMDADTWYYFDVAAAADNYTATATTLSDIICTTDGYAQTSAATGDVTLTAENNNLSATRYYVKSSSANNLVIGVSSYQYNVSEATTTANYIQPGNTVTVNYAVSTNDPNASLTQDYSSVTFGGNAITVTPTASGFTFTVPTVTAATDYTLSIPANAIGYADRSTFNAAQNITLKTPAIYDGTYFFRVAGTFDGTNTGTSAAVGKYLARGYNYGTHATIDKYGLAINIVTDTENKTTLSPADTRLFYAHDGTYDVYADKNSSVGDKRFFNIVKVGDNYRIHNTQMSDGTYFKYNNSDVNNATLRIYDDGNGTNSGPIIDWAIETGSQHATAMQALKDAQAAATAAAAYASGDYESLNGITTVDNLNAELKANYIQGDFVTPSAIESISEYYEGGQPAAGNTVQTVYSNKINITKPGFYKFSMQAFYRAAGNDIASAMHTEGVDFPPVVLFFGDQETQIKSIYDDGGLDQGVAEGYFETETVGGAPYQYNGKYYTNGQHNSVIIFQKDYYHNDVWFYCSTPGEYTYGVKYMGWAGTIQQWFIYSPESVTITSYAAAADNDDYDDLNDAIAKAEAKTIGFENGEYAPYNNKVAIAAIDLAKDIDQTGTNSKLLVQSAIESLGDDKWTVNVGELNAFYGGDFTKYETVGGEDMPYGWNLYNGASNHSRIMGGTEGSNNAGLSATSSGKALMLKFNATYGESEGYTLPLKASKLYRISFKHGRWNEANPRKTNVIVTDPDGNAITLAPGFQAAENNCQADNGPWYTFTGYFVSTTAGNYKVNFEKELRSGQNTQMQIAIADIELYSSTDDLVFDDNADVPTYAPGTYPSVKIARTLTAEKWATAVYPFAVSKSSDLKIATLNSYDAETGTLGFKAPAAIAANVPFLIRSAAGATEIALSNVEVAAASVTNAVASQAKLIGTYSSTDITDADKNYVLSSNTIYPVGTAGATIKPYRAYIQIDESAPARGLNFVIEDETTGISEQFVVNSEKAAQMYDLQGRKIEKPAKGLYIKNGKKLIVK